MIKNILRSIFDYESTLRMYMQNMVDGIVIILLFIYAIAQLSFYPLLYMMITTDSELYSILVLSVLGSGFVIIPVSAPMIVIYAVFSEFLIPKLKAYAYKEC